MSSDTRVYPGDDVIRDANMVYDQIITIPSSRPKDVFPWLLQVGAGRGGWYLPFSIERLLIPKASCASRSVVQKWTELKPGDVINDYRMPIFDKDTPTFEVIDVQWPQEDTGSGRCSSNRGQNEGYLVYKSERYGALFTWTLMARPLAAAGNEGATQVHLRFRGRIAATGLKAKLVVWGGGWMDYLSTAPMLAGLRDRVVAKAGKEHST